jgi:hypothetical protein
MRVRLVDGARSPGGGSDSRRGARPAAHQTRIDRFGAAQETRAMAAADDAVLSNAPATSSPSASPSASASASAAASAASAAALAAAAAARVPPLAPVQLATMVGTGFLFQGCASGRFSFAAAAWLCLLPLAVLVRTARLPVALCGALGAVFFGRLVGWVGVVDGVDDVFGAATAAALAAVLTMAALLAYRHVMRELPRAGSFALPLAVVVIEGIAASAPLPGLSLLPLSTTQASDVLLWRFVDVLHPLGVSFCVAWAQGAMAGFGESWIAEDPHDQPTRERGVRLGALSSFWVVAVGLHLGGFFVAGAGSGASVVADADIGRALTVGAAGVLVVLLAAATVVRVRRPSTSTK